MVRLLSASGCGSGGTPPAAFRPGDDAVNIVFARWQCPAPAPQASHTIEDAASERTKRVLAAPRLTPHGRVTSCSTLSPKRGTREPPAGNFAAGL
jgi:hypothetical protein